MKFKTKDLNEIPEAYRPLYTKTGDEWILTGVEGAVAAEDLASEQAKSVQYAGERDIARTELSEFKNKQTDPNKDKPAPKTDDNPILAELQKLGQRMDTFENRVQKAEEKDAAAQAKERRDTLTRNLQSVAKDAGVADSAIPDVAIIGHSYFETKEDGTVVPAEGSGLAAGTTPKVWIEKIKEDKSRQHWWGTSAGGGSKGSRETPTNEKNPFSHEHWNLTDQAGIIKTKGMEEATRMAQLAGATVGGERPAKAA